MAGIGFRLQRLLQRDSLSALVQAYGFSALIATGPMIVTLCALLLVHSSLLQHTSAADRELCHGLIVYAYAFSLVLLGPWIYVITRFLGDKHFLQQFDMFSSTYFSCAAVLLPLHGAVAAIYLLWLGLPSAFVWPGCALFVALTGTWLAMPFLSAARHFTWIVGSFLLGAVVSVLCVWALPHGASADAMLTAYTTGALCTLLTCCVRITREFGTPTVWSGEVFRTFLHHRGLLFAGLFYHAGLWIDRWCFWATPHADIVIPGLRLWGDYDTPMFLAQLTTLPTMAYFLVQIETRFAHRYHRYFSAIRDRAPRSVIMDYKDAMVTEMTNSFQRFVLLQGLWSGLLILAIVPLTTLLGLNAAQVGVLRIGILGSFLLMGYLICLNYFFYFDWQREAMLSALGFCVANGLGTWLTIQIGLPAYGFGFAIAAFLTFAGSLALLHHRLLQLEYWIIMRQPIHRPVFEG